MRVSKHFVRAPRVFRGTCISVEQCEDAMATDCVVDGDYLGAYSRFFAEFVARVNPNDQLPVKVSAYDVEESELVGEIIGVTLQYLNKT